MTTPVAALYSKRSYSYSASAPSTTPTTTTTTSSTSSLLFKRSTISIRPGDDPFASTTTYTPQDLGGEDWRISEESSAASRAETENGGAATTELGKTRQGQKPRRSSSFLRALVPSAARRSKSSTSLSISYPITSLDPPRIGPLRQSASLISLPRAAGRDSVVPDGIPPSFLSFDALDGSVTPGVTVQEESNDDQDTYHATPQSGVTTNEVSQPPGELNRLSVLSASSSASTPYAATMNTRRDTLASSYAPSTVISLREEIGPTSDRLKPSRPPPPTVPIPPVPFHPLLSRNTGPRAASVNSSTSQIDIRTSPVPPVPSLPPKDPRRYKGKKHEKTSSTIPSSSGPVLPIASLYCVFGLPKDPAAWSLSNFEADGTPPFHLPQALPRFWRPEVLGRTATGDQNTTVSLDGELKKGKMRSGKREKENFILLTKEEIARIEAKALKLAFSRDVEIISSTAQPPSTTFFFSFTIPSQTRTTPVFSGSTAAAWDANLEPAPRTLEKTFYAVSLMVWSHADATRTEAISATLQRGARAKQQAMKTSLRAASAGKKLGAKLAKQMAGPVGTTLDHSDTEAETDGFATESEWGERLASSRPLALLSSTISFWLPYSMVLVSTQPIFNLLQDSIRISWARYHEDLSLFSLSMHNLLHLKAPKPGELVSLPVSAEETEDGTYFVDTMPGEFNWNTGLQNNCFTLYPLFRTLDPENLLRIAETALSPLGRVLLISSHPLLLSIAVFGFKTILEKRGWQGSLHSAVHVRDLQIVVEDPGPYLLAIPSQSRNVALAVLPPEVAVVDLDTNTVRINAPHPRAYLVGAARDRARQRLATAIGNVSSYYSPPTELTEAFPAGRFRPFSQVFVNSERKDAERLQASWDWDEERTLREFDAILAEAPRVNLISRVLRLKNPRRLAKLDSGSKHVHQILRNHATNFMDRRDLLESRINRLNSKLALLMTESQEWQHSMLVFKSFSDKLTMECRDLKTRLDKESYEARRLEGQVGVERNRQARLKESLAATEAAREQALQQLMEAEAVRSIIEQQRNLLVHEMQTLRDADDTSPLFEAVYSRVEGLSHRSDTSSRPGTSLSNRRSSTFSQDRSLRPRSRDEPEPDDERIGQMVFDEGDDTGRLEALKIAVQESFSSIQSRLAIVLQNVEHLDSTRPTSSRFSPLLSPTIPTTTSSEHTSFSLLSPLDTSYPQHSSHTRSGSSPATSLEADDGGSGSEARPVVKPHQPKRFTPKPFQLTPPITPEENESDSVPNFVTIRNTSRRIRGSRRTDSIASMSSYTDDMDTPTAFNHRIHHSIASSGDIAPRRDSFDSFGNSREYNRSPIPRPSIESRQSFTDDDGQSFVSVSEGFTSEESGSEDEEETVVSSPGHSSRGHGTTSPARLATSVELFTRAAKRQSLEASSRQGEVKSRPVSAITVTPAHRY